MQANNGSLSKENEPFELNYIISNIKNYLDASCTDENEGLQWCQWTYNSMVTIITENRNKTLSFVVLHQLTNIFYNYTAILLCMYTDILLLLLWKTVKKWTAHLIVIRQNNYFIYLTLQFTLLLQAKIFWCISHCSEGLLWVMSRRRSTKPNSQYLHLLESQVHPSTLFYSVQNSFIVCYELEIFKSIVSDMPYRSNTKEFL